MEGLHRGKLRERVTWHFGDVRGAEASAENGRCESGPLHWFVARGRGRIRGLRGHKTAGLVKLKAEPLDTTMYEQLERLPGPLAHIQGSITTVAQHGRWPCATKDRLLRERGPIRLHAAWEKAKRILKACVRCPEDDYQDGEDERPLQRKTCGDHNCLVSEGSQLVLLAEQRLTKGCHTE